jgi:hypothetical protein
MLFTSSYRCLTIVQGVLFTLQFLVGGRGFVAGPVALLEVFILPIWFFMLARMLNAHAEGQDPLMPSTIQPAKPVTELSNTT